MEEVKRFSHVREEGDGGGADAHEQVAVDVEGPVDECGIVGMEDVGVHLAKRKADEVADAQFVNSRVTHLLQGLVEGADDTGVGVGDGAVEIEDNEFVIFLHDAIGSNKPCKGTTFF